ncbi:hypothetical protein CO709_12945 [Burkholderia thailandensis]|nr:hypothetical protein CO709_12945 [Burkholderia thailandensis]KST74855.1 hypothetical protein WS76_12290 [Burkholderia humptydooensis]
MGQTTMLTIEDTNCQRNVSLADWTNETDMDYRNLDLPPEAENVELSHFEPGDEWFASASPELQ